ncbi:hypothetical protein FOZ61_005277 [Perkinsus olseni]|uniref:Uncharacterized protein n=1 Tax=Perkinsus olseni TaxID=32597 RepID=A0A7J6LHM9_PEROL|nr:hypothetical protein FOZ61_005277 [Perkinsus olseni]
MADNFRASEITFLQQQNAAIFERMERCEGERDEALVLVRSWKDRRAEFERNFELTKNNLKAVNEIINNNSSEMSLKVEHLAQMAKQNQGLLTVLEQLESSKREIEEGERTRKENMVRLAVIERDFKSAKEEAGERVRNAKAQLATLKGRLRNESDKGNQKRTELMNLEARVRVDIEALEQAVQVVKQKNLEYVTRCNRDDQAHSALESERVQLQRELDELRELRAAKQRELQGEQENRDEFGRSKAVLMKEIDQEESLLLSRKSASAFAETTNEQLQQSMRAQDRNIREAADKTYALMDSLRAENVEYKKAESEDTSQEKRVRNLEKTCQNHTAKINMEISAREAAEAETKVKNTEAGGIKRKNKKFEECIAEAQKQAEKKQKEIKGLLAEVNAIQAKNASLSSRIDAGEEEINASRGSELAVEVPEIFELLGELGSLEDSCKELTESCSDLRTRISMANAANGQHRAKVQQLKNELAFIRREDGLDESGRQRPILIHSNDSTLVDKLQMNSFLYEAQQQRNPVPMLIEKIAQLLELLHFEQKAANRYLGDLAKSNSLVANLRQLNLELTGKKSGMTSFKAQLIGRVMGLVRAYGVEDGIQGLYLDKNLIDDNATTTLLTILHELPYLKYLDLSENQLSKEALNMVESQLRAMDGVTQTSHTADGLLEVRSGNQIRLKVKIGEQGACRPEASAKLIQIINTMGKGGSTDGDHRGPFCLSSSSSSSSSSASFLTAVDDANLKSREVKNEVEEVKSHLERPSGVRMSLLGIKAHGDSRPPKNTVPIGIGGPGDLSALDHRRGSAVSEASSASSATRRYGGREKGPASRKNSFSKAGRKSSREQLAPVVERAPDPKVLDKWQAGTYTKADSPE